MKTRKLGGLDTSVVGLGCNNFGMRCDEKQTAAVVGACLDSGINFFDTADVYGMTQSERFLGKALGKRRDEVLIATKFGNPLVEFVGGESRPIPEAGGASARWISRAVEGSLKRLGTDRIDLYQLHLPAGDVPIDETIEALDGLVREGKVREIGCSNFGGELIDQSIAVSKEKGLARWATVQNHYSLLFRQAEDDALPACERQGLGFLPYFPLANGMLTGKYRRGEAAPEGTRLSMVPGERAERILNEENFEIVEKLEAYAAERGHTLLELTFSWLLSNTSIPSVIAGATKPEQVKVNASAASWEMTPDEVAQISDIAKRG